MTKTRRQMAEYIKQVDAVCEVVDARIPQVSRNPDMDEIAAGKPRMMILNRIDLADPNMTAVWAKHFREQGMAVIQTELLAELVTLADERPVLQSVSGRRFTGSTLHLADGQTEPEIAFEHLYWQQIVKLELQTRRL